MPLQLRYTVCLTANKDTIYYVASASQYSSSSKSEDLLVLMRSDRLPTKFNAEMWRPISSTPLSYFYTSSLYIPGIVTCSVSSDGVFTFRQSSSGTHDHALFVGFRYHPGIKTRKTSNTCSVIGSVGDWERVDLLVSYDVKYFNTQIEVLPEAFNEAGAGGGGNNARMIFFEQEGRRISYAAFDSTGYLNKITSTDLKEVVLPTAPGVLEKVAYGDGQLYIIQATSYQDRDLGAKMYNRTLAVTPFTTSYPNSPGTVFLTDWNIDCSFSRADAQVAKGKLYYICVANETTRNLYIFDSKTRKTQGPVKIVEPSANQISLSIALTLVYDRSQPEEPKFAIVGDKYTVDLQVMNGTSANLTSMKTPDFVLEQNLAWTCRTSKQDRGLAIGGAVSGVLAALLLVWVMVRRRHRRAKEVDMRVKDKELELSVRIKDAKIGEGETKTPERQSSS
ncbi:hypothetical protein BGZ59_006919 [Podila verticillata]|nr:hypothetical protein BGZ59_006919 [Podila verticillata]